jgi:hypothetical protein
MAGSDFPRFLRPRLRPPSRSRHRLLGGAAALALAAALAGCGGSAAPHAAVRTTLLTAHGGGVAAPKAGTCPLTGLPAPGGRPPHRPALAIKVENLPEARPQSGLDHADIVYEEPVEGGITRFIAVFQCHEASRVEPVRSGRLVDPLILVQFGHPLLGYAGAIQPVVERIDHSGVVDLSFNVVPNDYFRDPARFAPHNLYTATKLLWAAHPGGKPPHPVFDYSRAVPSGATDAPVVHIPFSPYSDVFWKYSRTTHRYVRYYNGTVPATLSDGSTISAVNVVVQQVVLTPSPYVEDATGVHEWDVHVIGSGRAAVYRDGVMIAGRWLRPTLGDTTRFVNKHGKVIRLAPGNTWVELVPTTVTPTPF